MTVSEITTRKYLQYVTAFACHGKSPDQLGPNELLEAIKPTCSSSSQSNTRHGRERVAALRFFFIKTLKRHQFRQFLPIPSAGCRQCSVQKRVLCFASCCGTSF